MFRENTSEKVVYLTFDDGPHPETTPFILDELKKHNAKATFFLLGKNVEKYPKLFERIKEEGHSVGHHSYSHLNGWKTNTKGYLEDIEKGADLIQSNLFRPPYGKLTFKQYNLLKNKYKIIAWNVMPGDFEIKKSPKNILNFCRKEITLGSIIVLHENNISKDKLPFFLPELLDFLDINQWRTKRTKY